jgi:YgiT-type zinc finger domain-containing protein
MIGMMLILLLKEGKDMGVQAMPKPSKEYLLNIHERYMDCPACDGYMIPSTEDYIKQYKGQQLVIHNFPIFKCQCVGCQEVVYGTGDLYKYVRYAKKYFDSSGTLTFDANEIKNM